MNEINFDSLMWDILSRHVGHRVSVVAYGDCEDMAKYPADVCLECEDCGEVLLDAEIYTICAREDK